MVTLLIFLFITHFIPHIIVEFNLFIAFRVARFLKLWIIIIFSAHQLDFKLLIALKAMSLINYNLAIMVFDLFIAFGVVRSPTFNLVM